MVTGDTHIPGAMNNLSVATNQRGQSPKARPVKGSKHHKAAVKAHNIRGGHGPRARGPMHPVGKAR